jgi:hypothetical protein
LYGASLEISMFPNPMGNSFERSVGIAMGSSRSPLKAAKQTGSRFRIAQATSMPTKTGIGDAVLGPLKS